MSTQQSIMSTQPEEWIEHDQKMVPIWKEMKTALLSKLQKQLHNLTQEGGWTFKITDVEQDDKGQCYISEKSFIVIQ